MNQHFDILIDASGSMGYMKGTENENKLLLPDGSTRTDLVKKILINSIIPKLSFVENLTISTFRNEIQLDKNGKQIINNIKHKVSPQTNIFYNGHYDSKIINSIITKIENPKLGATPLFWAMAILINQKGKENLNLIVLSDGDANDRPQFDEEVLKTIDKNQKHCKIYFIGIDQNIEAQKKSRNLAVKTGGFYVNLNIMNYNEKMFDSMLFEWNATITSNALKDKLKNNAAITKTKPIIAIPDVKKETVIEVPDIKNKEVSIEVNKTEAGSKEIEIEKQTIEEIQPTDLIKQVEDNTKSLQLITSQLDSIVKEISFIRKGTSTDEDEFTANEDEANNRAIGYKCEKYLHSVFLKNNWEKVNWLNEVSEQSKPYDFEVTVKGINFYIECKGTVTSSKEFFLTKNEWLFYLKNRKNYRLYFVSGVNSGNTTVHRIEDILIDMEKGKLIPCSSKNRKVKAERILFQIID